MKTNFDHAIRSKMCQQVNTIPLYRLIDHLRLYFKYKIDGIWSKVLRSIPQVKEFSRVYRDFGERIANIEEIEDLLVNEWNRLITVNILPSQYLEQSDGRNFATVRWNLRIELSSLENDILSYSDGTLSLADLYVIVRGRYKETINQSSIQIYFCRAILKLTSKLAIVLIGI
jgi:hypothetical protein